MLGGTHAVLGLMCGAATARYFGVPVSLEMGAVLCAAVIGALVPDIDHPGSRISRSAPLAALPFRAVKHRGFTHSLIALSLVVEVMFVLHYNAGIDLAYAVAFACGYLSHLASDATTPRGIQFFYPLRWRVRIVPGALSIETGSAWERVFAVVALIAALLLLRSVWLT